ncbi:MAG: PAS domain-containing protein [Solirubrobacteraceae bacterium]|jgi:PAS domain-containing protein
MLCSILLLDEDGRRVRHRSRARYRQIVDTAYEGVWLLDSDTRTLFVNQRTARMLR